jgi:protein TonB
MYDASVRVAQRVPAARGLGLLAVIAVHAVLVAALWQYGPTRSAVVPKTSAILVQLLTPPSIAPPPPPPPPSRPRVAPKIERSQAVFVPLPEISVPVVQAPVISLVEPTPPPPVAEPMPATTPASVPAPPAPAPPPMTPPRFDADYLRNPAPEYPAFSKRRGEEGRVLLRVKVGTDGSPRAVEIQTTSGFERLDTVARDTVTRWKFVPARVGDIAVEAWVIVPISFRLTH